MHIGESNSISARTRCQFLMGAWGVVTLFMLFIAFPLYILAPSMVFYFPTGLFRLLGWQLEDSRRFVILIWVPYFLLTIWALATRIKTLYFRLFFCLCALLLLNIGGCTVIINENRPINQAQKRIEATKKQYKASELRAMMMPLFEKYSFDQSKPEWENYSILDPVPEGIASLPLFEGQQLTNLIVAHLQDDTNALVILVNSGFDSKWGIVVNRSTDNRELPQIPGLTFVPWEDGVYFYIGSNFPD
jgi:hypothetical protein